MALELCRVVLVETHYPGNLGATARVLGNMGLRELTLVAPIAEPLDPRALQMTARAEPILRSARVVAELGEAVADCAIVAATSTRGGGLFRQSAAAPEQIMPALVDVLRRGERAALVFGPEPSGLTNEQVSRCHHLIHIPTDAAQPALNLAQAVTICLYELRRAWLGTEPTRPQPATDELAPFVEQEQLFAQLRTALEEIHFLYGPKAEPLMHALRHLLDRARLTRKDVKLLHGLARQIRWYVAQHARDVE